jgi:hypothetical protein
MYFYHTTVTKCVTTHFTGICFIYAVSQNIKFVTEGGNTTSEVGISDAQSSEMGKGMLQQGWKNISRAMFFFSSPKLN